MQLDLFLYSPFSYCRVTGTTGEVVAGDDRYPTYGVVYKKGGLKITESSEPDQINQVLDQKNIFVSKPVGNNHAVIVQGDENGEAEWCCFSKNDSNNALNFVYQPIDGTFTLPANTGFVVIEGVVTADGIEADQDDYFRPRTQECTVVGTGTIVLISE